MESLIDKKTPNEISDKLSKNEIDEMHTALAFIATEIQRFQVCDTVTVMTKTFNENKIKVNNNYKNKLKNKRLLIATLRKDLKSACWVARNFETAKKREVIAIASQLTFARSECLDLLERYNNNISIISDLHKQNVSLHERLENLANFVSLAFEELQKLKSEKADENTTLAQLKKIIESCGQFYADYCNETEINSQIKQRNRFLKNKIIILENNIEAIKEQLKAVEYRCLRLKTANKLHEHIRARSFGGKCLTYSCSEVKKAKDNYESSSDEKHYQESGDSVKDQKGFDLTTHLDIVQKLLFDQDTLLKDLNTITKDMSVV